jgi:hypothetical protein
MLARQVLSLLSPVPMVAPPVTHAPEAASRPAMGDAVVDGVCVREGYQQMAGRDFAVLAAPAQV